MRDYALDKVFSNPDSTLHNKSPNQTVSKFIDIPRYIYSESYFTKLKGGYRQICLFLNMTCET